MPPQPCSRVPGCTLPPTLSLWLSACPGRCRLWPFHAEHPPHISPCSLMRACTQAVPKPIAGTAVPVLTGLRAHRGDASQEVKHCDLIHLQCPGRRFSKVLPPGKGGGWRRLGL